MRERKEEASKVKQTNKAKQHSIPKAVTFQHVHVHVHKYTSTATFIQASREEQAYHLLREWRKRKHGTVYALRTILTQAGIDLDSHPSVTSVTATSPAGTFSAVQEFAERSKVLILYESL